VHISWSPDQFVVSTRLIQADITQSEWNATYYKHLHTVHTVLVVVLVRMEHMTQKRRGMAKGFTFTSTYSYTATSKQLVHCTCTTSSIGAVPWVCTRTIHHSTSVSCILLVIQSNPTTPPNKPQVTSGVLGQPGYTGSGTSTVFFWYMWLEFLICLVSSQTPKQRLPWLRWTTELRSPLLA
jgi:hypothetical protein